MSGAFEVRSEAKGAHWIAWVCRDGQGTPDGAVVLVGQTQKEAEDRARAWGERTPAASAAPKWPVS